MAMTFLRLVLAYTIWHYDLGFAPGETGVDIYAKAVNQLILKAGPPYCLLRNGMGSRWIGSCSRADPDA
jgi:hypothetical protein